MNTNEYKIKGWVARDNGENGMGEVYFGTQKPIWDEEMRMWDYFGESVMKLPTDWYIDLKCTDKPIEVELTIKKA